MGGRHRNSAICHQIIAIYGSGLIISLLDVKDIKLRSPKFQIVRASNL